MNQDPAALQTMSLRLARVLDEIGLNQETVDGRRRAFLFIEHLNDMRMNLTNWDASVYHFGSQTEGTTTPGLRSDVDSLTYYYSCNAIQDWDEWEEGKINLLMLHGDTEPGYCRLQRLMSDKPLALENLVDDKNYEYDSSGRVLLKNTCSFTPTNDMGQVRNGPAESLLDRTGALDSDDVNAVKCGSWPRQAEEFTRRQRRHNWPSHGDLQQIVEQGCFLVPVGHKLSPTEHLEWRLSASLAERCLMFRLSIMHLKVYVLLKMLVKSFVEPRARKCISSYHCKTALLYCTENTEAGFWVERNILQCVTRCLAMLLSWVTECFCPQFIIPDVNLFAGKVTAQNSGTLKSILRDLIRSNGCMVLDVPIDNVGAKLLAKLSIEPSVRPVWNSKATVLLMGKFEYDMFLFIMFTVNILRTHFEAMEQFSAIRYVYTNIEKLKDRNRQLDKPKQLATEAIIEFLYDWLGSMLASVFLSDEKRVPRVAIQLLRIKATSNIAAMLKLASVLYSNGDYRKVESVLQGVNNHFSINTLQSICRCYEKPISLNHWSHGMMYVTTGRRARAKLIAPCVVFSRQEIHCEPPALRNEHFRSVGDDLQHRHPQQDAWMVLAVVDCLPYLHYLQYMTYRQLRKHDLQKQSLLNLERCIGEDNDYCHLETDWNLLGQCMELEEDPEAAMACYRKSLDIRPRNNAATDTCSTCVPSGRNVAVYCSEALRWKTHAQIQVVKANVQSIIT